MRVPYLPILFSLIFSGTVADHETVSHVNPDKFSVARERRYLVYDVNHGEGFNLRRDVYMRIANAVRMLREDGQNFHLVLPPWGGLYHWDRQEVRQPWSKFFDLKALNEFVPVMEFEDYLKETSSAPIDQVVYLQHFMEGWGDHYEHKYERRDCNDGSRVGYKKEGGLWKGWFFSYREVRAREFQCTSFQGDSVTLKDMILKEYSGFGSIFVDRGETVLHAEYGGYQYWAARRSMRYAPHLMDLSARFRLEKLDSNDEKEKTLQPASWRDESAGRPAVGGDYICAHWRRRDFVRAHGKELPSIEGTAKILNKLASKYKVSKVFLATDAQDQEVAQLEKELKFPVVRFDLDKNALSDGEIAVVDQIVCSRARYFTGSHVSTFSFRIQEDREVVGFPVETTFNRMCPDGQKECEQPAKWKIVHS